MKNPQLQFQRRQSGILPPRSKTDGHQDQGGIFIGCLPFTRVTQP